MPDDVRRPRLEELAERRDELAEYRNELQAQLHAAPTVPPLNVLERVYLDLEEALDGAEPAAILVRV